jgi:endonuclease YncB( thermonuclease family)
MAKHKRLNKKETCQLKSFLYFLSRLPFEFYFVILAIIVILVLGLIFLIPPQKTEILNQTNETIIPKPIEPMYEISTQLAQENIIIKINRTQGNIDEDIRAILTSKYRSKEIGNLTTINTSFVTLILPLPEKIGEREENYTLRLEVVSSNISERIGKKIYEEGLTLSPIVLELNSSWKIGDVVIIPQKVEYTLIFKSWKAREGYKLVIIEFKGINKGVRKSGVTIKGGELKTKKGYYYEPKSWSWMSFDLLPEEEGTNYLVYEILKNDEAVDVYLSTHSWSVYESDRILKLPSSIPNSPTLLCKGNARCYIANVTYIVDGDTLEVKYENKWNWVMTERIRLALVDAPEKGEPGYEEAKEFVSFLCPIGSEVVVDQDDLQLYDKYGRMLAVVYCKGKYNLNAALLYSGLAKLVRYYCDKSEFGKEEWAVKFGC